MRRNLFSDAAGRWRGGDGGVVEWGDQVQKHSNYEEYLWEIVRKATLRQIARI